MSDGIRTPYKNCAFNVHYTHLKPIGSRKVKLPFWNGKGQCSVKDCSVKVILTINSTIVLSYLTANVSIEGQCSHMPTSANNSKVVLASPNRRRLTGEARQSCTANFQLKVSI
jgi:hypothetical protein